MIKRVGHTVRWCSLALVFVTVSDVALRYLFNSGMVALQEIEWNLFSALFLFGSAYALSEETHVRVDVFQSRFSDKTKALIDIFGTLVFLLPFTAVVIVTSLGFVGQSFALMEGSPDPGGLPLRFLSKAMIPLGFSLILAQGLFLLKRNIDLVLGRSKNER